MIMVKNFFGVWKEATKEQAEDFYKHFVTHATAIKNAEKQGYFNEHHIRGARVLLDGTIEVVGE